MSKIMTMGEILVEIMAKDVGQSFLRPGTLLGPYASGAPAIFIDQVARLGHPSAMIGCVGDDDFGRLNTNRLKADGVDVSGISVLPDVTIAQLLALGIKEIVIKRGADGASYADAAGRIDIAAMPAVEIDPTGAGDCFGGTFVACRKLGMAPAEALRFANTAGALAVGQRGPMEGASDFKQLHTALAAGQLQEVI